MQWGHSPLCAPTLTFPIFFSISSSIENINSEGTVSTPRTLISLVSPVNAEFLLSHHLKVSPIFISWRFPCCPLLRDTFPSLLSGADRFTLASILDANY